MNSNTGFAIGSTAYPPPTNSAGIISRTTDGGHSWNDKIFPVALWLNSIKFKGNTGIACGIDYYGVSTVLRTTNNGINWVQTLTSTHGDLQSIEFLNDSIIILTGFVEANGIVLRSSNWGENWTLINSTTPSFTYGIHFQNILTGFWLD